MTAVATSRYIQAGASGAILFAAAFAFCAPLFTFVSQIMSALDELHLREERIAALHARLEETRTENAMMLARIGAASADLAFVNEPARINALLEEICTAIAAVAETTECTIAETPIDAGLAEYRAEIDASGSIALVTAALVDVVAPPVQAVTVTLNARNNAASATIGATLRIVGVESGAGEPVAAVEGGDSES